MRFFQRTATTGRLLNLNGGSGELIGLIKEYLSLCRHITALGKMQPIILLIDNDAGADGIFKYINNLNKPVVVTRTTPIIFVGENVYIIPTPLTSTGKETMIEDFFDASLLKTELNGKTFNPDEKTFDHKTQYGKAYFAEHVVKKDAGIDFKGFKPILDRIDQVILEHSKRVEAKSK